ncbi:MAG TPA: hypothetical protein VF018_05330 [Acidobacteriaceae bacterium]
MRPVWLGILVLFVVGILGAAIFSPSPADQATTHKQQDASEARFQLALGGALTLRKAMRNPSSFDLASALVADDDSAVCYGYRAQNGFGGMNVDHAVLTRTAFVNSSDARFHKLWKQNCAAKGMHFYDLRDDVMAGLRQYDALHNY